MSQTLSVSSNVELYTSTSLTPCGSATGDPYIIPNSKTVKSFTNIPQARILGRRFSDETQVVYGSS